MNSATIGGKDKRKYPRLASGVRVRWRMLDASGETREYLTGIAENFGFGGVFLVSTSLFPKGTVLQLDFSIENESPVSANAVVRWTRRFKQPTGLGLEFVEFMGIGDRPFETLMNRIFIDDANAV